MAQKIAVYSISDLKNTTDDALVPYLKHRKRFDQKHFLSDVRLGLGYTAVIIAAALFYFDYTSTWAQTRAWTLPAVLVYFTLNSLLTLWIWGVEKGKIFIGSRDTLLISVASETSKKYDPVYRLKIRSSDTKGSPETVLEVQSPFMRWFTADGQLVEESLFEWLDSSVPFLTKSATKR